eukprot:1815184-Rhodomonas_salina.1
MEALKLEACNSQQPARAQSFNQRKGLCSRGQAEGCCAFQVPSHGHCGELDSEDPGPGLCGPGTPRLTTT